MADWTVERGNAGIAGASLALSTNASDAEQVFRATELASNDSFQRTPFQRSAFLRAFYRNLPDGCTPLVVSVRQSDRLAMVFPLIRRETQMLSYIEPADLGLSDYVAPIVADWFEPSPPEMADIWNGLRRYLPPADILSLKKIPAMLTRSRINPLTLLPGTVEMGTSSKQLDLSNTDGATHFRRSGLYKEGMKKFRKLKQLGSVEFRMAGTREEAQKLFDVLIEQRTVRFQALGRPDPLLQANVGTFYRELAVEGVPSGQVMFGGLYLDGDCIATDLGLVEGTTHHGLLTAMAVGDIERLSPGTVNFMLMLDETVARGLRRYDIGVGEFFYKSRLKGSEMTLYERHEALSLRGNVALAEARARRMIRLGLSRYPHLRKPVEGIRQQLRRLRNFAFLAPAGIAELQPASMGLGLL